MFNLKEIVIAFVVVGILLGFGALILSEVQEETYEDTTLSENITLNNGTAVALSHNNLNSFRSLVNASNTSEVISTANYSVSLAAGTVTLSQPAKGSFDGNLSTATYNYPADTAASNATGEAIEAVGDLAGWLPLLALVIIAAIIIGYLLVSFATEKTSGSL